MIQTHTFDVTNLSHQLGKQTISFWTDKYPETLHQIFNKKIITDGVVQILNKYSFQFNNVNYIQTIGTVMGTKTPPTFATLTLTYLEENLYKKK